MRPSDIRFSEIKTKEDLARVLGIPTKILTYLVYISHTDTLYSSFEINKKDGGTRQINAPTKPLKKLQRRLARCMWEDYKQSCSEKGIRLNIAHGFVPGKSIITNALVHRNKRTVINFDLEHFFDSFHFGRVKGFFEKNRNYKLPTEVAGLIANLVCYNGCLPQGAPTSPIITNLICQIMDYKILKLAKQYKLDYTRYADDLSFSTNDKTFDAVLFDEFKRSLQRVVESAGFYINESKTRISYKDSRQTVTGLVVNKKVNVQRDFYKKTKAMAHSLYQNGSFEINGKEGTLKQLEGRFAFIDSVVHNKNSLDKASQEKPKDNSKSLMASELQYRHFLFYKYFYANEVPTIVTEGKTDIRYLKAALKNRYKDYPELITYNGTDSDGKEMFSFNVYFLNRTPLLWHLFGLNVDGADGMNSLNIAFHPVPQEDFSNASNNEKKQQNQLMKLSSYSYIQHYRVKPPKHPTILIFDNEFDKEENNARKSPKPLFKYVYCNKFGKSEKNMKQISDRLASEIKVRQFARVYDDSSLYIATMPIIDDSAEIEMENLFDQDWLYHKLLINEKTFDISEKPSNTTFSKTDLSKYVEKNYKDIDFSGFDGLLDVIRNAINDYHSSLTIEKAMDPDNS